MAKPLCTIIRTMNLLETIELLKELDEEVPKPMRLPTIKDVEKAEKELGMEFHPDYKHYLLSASNVTYGTIEPLVPLSDYPTYYIPSIAKKAWEYGVPTELIPICEDNGDYFCIDKNGLIKFWSHDGPTDEKWNSLADWINDVWIGEN